MQLTIMFAIRGGRMTDKEKEIQATYTKYAKKALSDCENMTIEEEKKYIDENESKMKSEIQKIIKKYDTQK